MRLWKKVLKWENNKDTKSWNETCKLGAQRWKYAKVKKITPHNETTFLIGTMVQLDQLELLDQITLHESLCGTTNEQQNVKW
jgi:hypothetical protein